MCFYSYGQFRDQLARFFSEEYPENIDAVIADCLGVCADTLFKTGKLAHNSDGEKPYFISWEFFSEGAIVRFGVRHSRFRGKRVEWYLIGLEALDEEHLAYRCAMYSIDKEEG